MNITVFTPTFNRAYIIEDLYKSLKRQNYEPPLSSRQVK